MKDWQFIIISFLVMIFSIMGLVYIVLGDFGMTCFCSVIALTFCLIIILDNKK